MCLSVTEEKRPLLKAHFTWKACTLLCKAPLSLCRPNPYRNVLMNITTQTATLNAYLPTATVKPSISYTTSLCVCIPVRMRALLLMSNQRTTLFDAAHMGLCRFKETQQVSARLMHPANQKYTLIKWGDKAVRYHDHNHWCVTLWFKVTFSDGSVEVNGKISVKTYISTAGYRDKFTWIYCFQIPSQEFLFLWFIFEGFQMWL